MLSKYLTEKNVFFASLVLLVIILSMPYIVRTSEGNDTFMGSFSYYHARIARETLEKGRLPAYDNYLSEERDYVFNPYHLFLAFSSKSIGIEAASRFMPFLLGILSFLVFYLVLRNLRIKLLHRLLILAILILSPLYVYTFSVSNLYSLVILLDLLGLYFFIKRKGIFLAMSILFFLSTVFFEPINTLVVLLLLLSYSLYKREKIRHFVVAFIVLFSVYISYYTLFYLSYGLPISNGRINFFESNITDFGALIGFSVFTLFSSLVGLFASWKEKKKLVFVYITIFMLFSLSYFTSGANYYLNFFLSVFAGFFSYKIVRMKWKIKLIGNLTVLFLLYGFVFSTASYIPRMSALLPNNEVAESLSWLGSNSKENSIVFSYPESGFWIEYFSERPVLLDPLTGHESRWNDTMIVLDSRSLKETKKLLSKYNVSYVYIDDALKQKLGENKGLLFLLRNNETFKMVYNNSYTSIWKYAKGD